MVQRVNSLAIAGVLAAIVIVVACAAQMSSGGSHPQSGDEKARRAINNYACYYGPADTEALSVFDMVIIEPRQFSKDEIASLAKNTVVVGYVSIGELGPERLSELAGKGTWFLDRDGDGKPDRNPHWGSFYADPGSDTWRAYIISEVRKVISEKGCSGIFMDTLDTIDQYPEATVAMARLVREIRGAFPEIYLVANRGFELVPHIGGSIDAVMFEAFSGRPVGDGTHAIFSREDMAWTHEIYSEKLSPFMDGGGIVLSLDYADPSETKVIDIAWTRALDYGFIPHISQADLQSVSTIKGNDIPDYRRLYGKAAFEKP